MTIHLILYLTFAVAIIASAFLIIYLRRSLKAKVNELLQMPHELETSNARLTSLYKIIKEINSHSKLQELMDSSTCCAAQIMEVKGCSIKLLDEEKRNLRFVSTYGLSDDYVSKGSIHIDKSPINRRIIDGSPFSIGRIDEAFYFQFPEDIQKEGIASMLCLPLRVEKRIFGIFCVYSDIPNRFGESDIEFFSLVTDLTALAIENLRSRLTHSWFMMKAAHQLRAPLNAIYSWLKLLRDGYLGSSDERQEQIIMRCQVRIAALKSLINDLLKLGEERSEAVRPVFYAVDPVKAMAGLMDSYQSQAVEKRLHMDFHIQDTIPKILANEKILDELFTNLISNAIKYTPQGGKVEVTLSREGQDSVRFEVSDTGIGIAEEDLPRLFTEFFRTETAKALTEEGTGLGLVIVKEIVDRLGGTIQVKSTFGQGACFTCLLPLIPEP